MNSLLQQLYHIPCFRYLLLSCNDKKEEEIVSIDDEKSAYHGKPRDDNVLH
jgi:ubiquitin carboxyl-terminal hydrolase 34